MDNNTRTKRQKLDDSNYTEDESLLFETLKNRYSSKDNLDNVMKMYRENQNLQSKLQEDIDLIMLHVACYIKDKSLIEDLLNNGVNVNAQISENSPIWPGYTPLHVCMHSFNASCWGGREDFNVIDILRLLLHRGADVTLTNKKQRTPIHMAYQHYICNLHYCGLGESNFMRLPMLLKAQKDFKVNPKSLEGITHFHIACSLPDFATVENFLKCGKININQPLNFDFEDPANFKNFSGAGCTPIHLTAMRKSEYVELSAQLETIDLLLKYGADVNARKSWAETPFHVAVLPEVRQKLVSGGADVNAEYGEGYTPLEDLLNKRPRSIDKIIELIRWGCIYNAFNSNTEMGFIGLSGRSLSFEKMQDLISTVFANFPDLIRTDPCQRTPIYNLVSVYQIYFSPAEYAVLIEQLTMTGCDIDDQDDRGRTALHMAAKFKNMRAMSGLLMAGADINIADNNGQMAFVQKFQPCPLCSRPADAEDEQCGHYRVFKCLALQVRKLQLCGLDVHPANKHIIATYYPNCNRVNVTQQFIVELEEMQNVNIESVSLPVCRFLSEIDVVGDYPTMSKTKKNAIDEFFRPGEKYNQFREKYSEIAGILKLQYRKAVKRAELLQKANTSLVDLLACFQVPELCSRIIIRYLSNAELQAVIIAAEYLMMT